MSVNEQGSGATPVSTDTPVREDAQQAVDTAKNAIRLHEKANQLAEKGKK